MSPRDAETYRRLATKAMGLLPMFLSGFYSPPLPMGAKVRPEEARAALKLLDFRTVVFLLSLLFRPTVKKPRR